MMLRGGISIIRHRPPSRAIIPRMRRGVRAQEGAVLLLGVGLSAVCLPAACLPLHDLNDLTDGGEDGTGSSGMLGGEGGQNGSGGEPSGAGGSSPADGGSESGGSQGMTGGQGGDGPEPEFCSDEYVFCDDFEDDNPSEWTPSGGLWGVLEEDENLYYQGSGSEESVAGEPAWTNVSVEARVRVNNFGGATDGHRVGLMARYENSSSFYVFALGGDGNATLRKSTSTLGGSLGTCAPAPVAFQIGEWVTLRIEVTGGNTSARVKTYVNEVEIHNCTTNSNIAQAGTAGVSTFGSNTRGDFDDVRVMAL